ncbi:hypothetical protein ACFX2G_036222 [Malus domestica]
MEEFSCKPWEESDRPLEIGYYKLWTGNDIYAISTLEDISLHDCTSLCQLIMHDCKTLRHLSLQTLLYLKF